MIIPIPLAIFRDMHLICFLQFDLLSIIIPPDFALSTPWISAPHIWIVGQISFVPLSLNILKFVLSILRESRLAFNHCMILLSSLLTVANNFVEIKIVWSSYLHNGISHTGKMTNLYWIIPNACNGVLCLMDRSGLMNYWFCTTPWLHLWQGRMIWMYRNPCLS